MKVLEKVKKRLTSINRIFYFPIGIAIICLIILYIHTRTPEIFIFLGQLAFFLILYCLFTGISQNILNYDNVLFFSLRYLSIHRKFLFTHKELKEVTLGINLMTKIVFCIFFFYIASIPLRYIFTFMHEISHALVAIFYRIEISEFVINVGGTSYVSYPFLPYGPETSNLLIAGSLGTFILGIFMIIFIISRKRIRIEVFLSFFAIISILTLSSIDYWIYGALNNYGDAIQFLQNTTQINSSELIRICSVVKNLTITLLVELFTFKIIFIIRRRIHEILPNFSQTIYNF